MRWAVREVRRCGRQSGGFLIAFLPLLVAYVPCFGDASVLQTLRFKGFQVEYPAGYRKQAMELAAAAHRALDRPLRIHRKQRARLSQPDVPDQICRLLGTPEDHKWLRGEHREWVAVTEPLSTMPRRFRIYVGDKLPGSTFSMKGMSITSGGSDSALHLSISSDFDGPATKSARPFFPILVNRAGRFQLSKGENLQGKLAGIGRGYHSSHIAVLHELIESVLVLRRGLYGPFARWFNDGLANWAALRIARRLFPGEEWTLKIFWPSETRFGSRESVNLFTWRQHNYEEDDDSQEKAAGEALYYFYATEAVDRMFNGLPDSAISSVLSDLKRSRRATTEQILTVIQSVTERPARRILLSYAPPSYREAVESGKSWALIGQAGEKVSEGKHSAAYLMLKEALELEPDHVEARLQMAYLMRKLGRLAPWVDRELRIICGGHNASVRLNVPKDADSQFIAGRLAQLGGDAKAAE